MDFRPTVTLWLPPSEDHARALIAGWVNEPRSEYEAAIEGAIEVATIAGHRVLLCDATVSEVRAEMRRLDVKDTPAGRVAAFASLAGRAGA